MSDVEHKNVYAALAAAQGEMKAPEKNAQNPGFKRDGKPMKYADLSSVVESIRGPLSRHGLSWGWRTVVFRDEMAMQAWISHGATETEVTCDVPIYVDRQNMHALKSAYTYAKRIGLESVSGQAPADDDDGNGAVNGQGQPKDNAPKYGEQAFEAAADSLRNADTLDALRAIWSGLPRAVQESQIVIAAKDERKEKLETPTDADLDDEIPY